MIEWIFRIYSPRESSHDAPEPPLRIRAHPLYPRVVAGAARACRKAARGARDLVGQAPARARGRTHHGPRPRSAVAVRLRQRLLGVESTWAAVVLRLLRS